jgi:acetylornithine deacetylase
MDNLLSIINLWINKNKDFILQSLSEIIQIKTENKPPYGDEKKGQEYLYNLAACFLPINNIDLYDIEKIKGIKENPLFFPEIDSIERIYKDRPNLIIKMPGERGKPSLLFSGHIDTHPALGQKWRVFKDPFSGKFKDGRIFGRGSADMKSGTLAGFMAIKCLSDLKIKLRGSVFAESVVDEEFGGVNGTIASRIKYPEMDFALLTEPTGMIAGIETRGGTDFKIWVNEANPGGINTESLILPNPIYKLSKVALALQKYEKSFHKKREIRIFTYQLASGGQTYLESQNIPTNGHLYFWIEVPSGVTEEETTNNLMSFIKREYYKYYNQDEKFPEFKKVIRFMEGHKTDLNNPFMDILSDSFNFLDISFKKGKLAIACDAFVFKKVSGTEVCVLGPKGGNLHAMDEFVEIESFLNLIKIMVISAVKYCS